MSIKRQIQHKYRNFKSSAHAVSLPTWLFSPFVRLGLFSLIFLFSFAYILSITDAATSGYQVKELEKRTQALKMEVQKLEVEIADNSSIITIASRLEKLQMVEALGVKHLGVKNNSVSKN